VEPVSRIQRLLSNFCWISALWHFVTPRRTGDVGVQHDFLGEVGDAHSVIYLLGAGMLILYYIYGMDLPLFF
jgi:hypothetical protein